VGPAINVAPLNSVAMEKGFFVFSPDGRTIYFAGARAGGFGGLDIYVANRVDPDDDLGWTTPVNLGPDVNTAFREAANGCYFNGNQSKDKRLLFVASDGTQDPSPVSAETCGRPLVSRSKSPGACRCRWMQC
jgi:WD40 repeat protein